MYSRSPANSRFRLLKNRSNYDAVDPTSPNRFLNFFSVIREYLFPNTLSQLKAFAGRVLGDALPHIHEELSYKRD
jgi:hypothetical protein